MHCHIRKRSSGYASEWRGISSWSGNHAGHTAPVQRNVFPSLVYAYSVACRRHCCYIAAMRTLWTPSLPRLRSYINNRRDYDSMRTDLFARVYLLGPDSQWFGWIVLIIRGIKQRNISERWLLSCVTCMWSRCALCDIFLQKLTTENFLF